jgi:hypothetical protein
MSAVAELLAGLAHTPIEKRAITNSWGSERGVCLCEAELVLAGDADRSERADHPADFGDGEHR